MKVGLVDVDGHNFPNLVLMKHATRVKLRGVSSMLNIGECPNAAVESFLSRILQPMEDVQKKYYLSRKACLGILRRAQERGKELPEELRIALERQAR